MKSLKVFLTSFVLALCISAPAWAAPIAWIVCDTEEAILSVAEALHTHQAGPADVRGGYCDALPGLDATDLVAEGEQIAAEMKTFKGTPFAVYKWSSEGTDFYIIVQLDGRVS